MLPTAFGATDKQAATYQVKTKDEVESLFADESFNASDKLRLVELYMPRDDAPEALKMTAQAAEKRNSEKE
jgi:pyruvate decarboxylase